MRVTARAIAAATFICAGILVGPGASPAMASVAAPHCDSSTSHFTCDAVGGWVSPVTWTITSTNSGGSTTTQVVTTTGHLFAACHALDSEQVFYSFFDGTQTQTSGTARFRCNPAPPA
jgi:hypothetical protein